MAIVKYGCGMDILTDGEGNKTKIARCVAAALGCEPDTAITKDGRKLEDIVNLVFNDGRSALAHGSDFGALTQWVTVG